MSTQSLLYKPPEKVLLQSEERTPLHKEEDHLIEDVENLLHADVPSPEEKETKGITEEIAREEEVEAEAVVALKAQVAVEVRAKVVKEELSIEEILKIKDALKPEDKRIEEEEIEVVLVLDQVHLPVVQVDQAVDLDLVLADLLLKLKKYGVAIGNNSFW